MNAPGHPAPSPLLAYLLGSLEYEDALRLQRGLAFQLASGTGGAVALCEHPPLITVGRHGSPADIRFDPAELAARRWAVRWVPRGGGCVLHLPGQTAIYPVLSLARLGIGVVEYLQRLQKVLVAALDDFGIRAGTEVGHAGVVVAGRPIASVGIAVRQGMTLFGAVLNVDPDLTLCRLVHSAREGAPTSVARERKGPLRHALVRQRILEHFASVFGFSRTELMFHPPGRPGHERLPERAGRAVR